MSDRRRLGALVVAVAGTALVATAPIPGLSPMGQFAVATMVFAAVLWLTEALPLPVTALLVPVLLTAFGVFPTLGGAFAGFADPVIFLLLSGFVLARALQKHGVDRLVAYRILGTLGTSPRRLVFAVMVATAGLSMVISNSATTAMMAPIAFGVASSVVDRQGDHDEASGDDGAASSVVDGQTTDETSSAELRSANRSSGQRPREDGDDGAASSVAEGDGGGALVDARPGQAGSGARRVSDTNIGVAMLLGTAYAASLGGVGTIVGSPPNAIVVAQLEATIGYRVGFVDWMLVGLPIVLVTVPLTWYLLTYHIYPPSVTDVSAARAEARTVLRESGGLSTEGRRVVAIAAATAGLWLTGGLDFLFVDVLPPAVHTTLFGGDGPNVLGGTGHRGLLHFTLVGLLAIPALVLADTLEWDDVEEIDWGTLLLLGGGISLANALATTDATQWLADGTVALLRDAPVVVVVLGLVVVVVALGELASNTAMAAILAPLLISLGPRYAAALGTTDTLASVFLAMTGGIAASFGFALPVATPPNAIVFGTGHLTKDQMLRAGVVLDAVMVLVGTGLLVGGFQLLF